MSDKHAETNYGHFAPFVIQEQQKRAETNYGHSAPFVIQGQ